MQVKSIAECFKGSILQILSPFIKLPFVIKIFVLSIFKWSFYTGFTVFEKYGQIPFKMVNMHTLYILMDCPIHIDTISMNLSIYQRSKFINFNIFLSLNIIFILANGADPEKSGLKRHFIWVFTVCNSTC